MSIMLKSLGAPPGSGEALRGRTLGLNMTRPVPQSDDSFATGKMGLWLESCARMKIGGKSTRRAPWPSLGKALDAELGRE